MDEQFYFHLTFDNKHISVKFICLKLIELTKVFQVKSMRNDSILKNLNNFDEQKFKNDLNNNFQKNFLWESES